MKHFEFESLEYQRRLTLRHLETYSGPARPALEYLTRLVLKLNANPSPTAPAPVFSDAEYGELFQHSIDALDVLLAGTDNATYKLLNAACEVFKEVGTAYPLPTADEVAAMFAAGEITSDEYAAAIETAA
jgi:hypothetical protein